MESKECSLTFVVFTLLRTVTLLNFLPYICEPSSSGLENVGGNSLDTNRLLEPGTALSHGGASALASLLRFYSPIPLYSRMMSSLRSPLCVVSFPESNPVFDNHVARVKSTDADDLFPNLQIGSYWEDKTHIEDKWV